MDRAVFRSAQKGVVQPIADSVGAPFVAIPECGAVAGAAARIGTNKIFRPVAALGFPACALDRIRSDAAEDRSLLAARDGRGPAASGRFARYKDVLGQRNVVVGNRNQTGV